jgi:hypothetical protein
VCLLAPDEEHGTREIAAPAAPCPRAEAGPMRYFRPGWRSSGVWRKPRGIRLTPISRYVRDRLFGH